MQWNKWIVRRVSNQRRPLLLKRVSARSAYPLDLSNAISCSVCLGDGSTHSDLGSSSKTWPSRPCLRRLFFWRTSSKELPHGLWRLFFSYICLDQVELPLCSLFSSSPTFLFFFLQADHPVYRTSTGTLWFFVAFEASTRLNFLHS